MRKKIKALIGLGIMLGIISSTTTSFMAVPQNVVAENTGEYDVQPRTDIKEWRYKVINGNLYKRLYNYSTGRWEGDWIFVASGVEEL